MDSCADSLDNEIYFQNGTVGKTTGQYVYSAGEKNLTLHPGDTDCADSDCTCHIVYSGGSHILCNGVSSFATESLCSDGLDNDMDGATDLDDGDCSGTSEPNNYVVSATSGWNLTNDQRINSQRLIA